MRRSNFLLPLRQAHDHHSLSTEDPSPPSTFPLITAADMASTLLPRALRPSHISKPQADSFVCTFCRRDQSTYTRTRKALRVKPDPSFHPSTTEPQDHIIYNPPSSLPSVYHTPSKFLPKSDPRRKLHSLAKPAPPILSPTTTVAATASTPSALSTIASLRRSSATSKSSSSSAAATVSASALPSVRPNHERKLHLSQQAVDEIRRLRAEDPRKWTRMALAEKFECSQFFVSLCCSAPQRKAEAQQALAEVKMRWGRRRTEARAQRAERKKMWGRDA
nr:54s ribosomal protein l20, mitochondrial [Quercus suber]